MRGANMSDAIEGQNWLLGKVEMADKYAMAELRQLYNQEYRKLVRDNLIRAWTEEHFRHTPPRFFTDSSVIALMRDLIKAYS